MTDSERLARDLERYLARPGVLGPGEVPTVHDLTVPEGVGHSNETVLFTVRRDGGDERFVLRLQPQGPGVFPDYDLGLQVACMRAVGEATGAPTPVVRWYEPDPSVLGAPFYVMEHIDGDVPRDRMPYTLDGWLKDAEPADQARLYDASLEAMAEVHRADWRHLGLAGLDRRAFGAPGLAQQLGWWEEYARWVARDRAHATVDAAGRWLRAEFPRTEPPVGITWGDARLSNIMYRDFLPVALLDWEMAALGPAEVDLAWFLFFGRFFSEGLGVPDLPGFPSRAEVVARYGELLGRELADLGWFEVFAAWRHTVVMARLADLYEATGEIPPGTDARTNNIASRMLAALLGLPSPGPPGGPFG